MADQPETRTGRCLCGAVSFSVVLKARHADVCHCGMCRRWSGGPSLSVQATSTPAIEGADQIAVYASSEWGERHFCKLCGSNLFYAAPAFGYFGVAAGALDDQEGLELAMEIFIDAKPAYYSFAGDARKLTEAEFLAMVGAAPPADAGAETK